MYGRELTGSVSSPTASRFGRVWSGTLPKGDEDTENDWDEGGHKGPAGNGEGIEFDDDVNFASPFLRGILSDQQLVPDFKGAMAPTTPAANVGMELKGRKPSEDGWENM